MIHAYLENKPQHIEDARREEQEIKKIKIAYNKASMKCGMYSITKKMFLEIIKSALRVTSSKTYYSKYKYLIETGRITVSNGIVTFNG
jgi:hypothetical protein